MPELTNDQLTIALAGVGGIALVAIILAASLAVRLGKVRRAQRLVFGEGRQERDVVEAIGNSIRHVRALERRIDALAKLQEGYAAHARSSLQKIGLVRYDAFEEMGGRLSFSAALLDDHGDGIVISSINGRTETRTYAKPIKNLQSSHNLSQEEHEAIAEALSYGVGESRDSVSR